MKNTVALVFIFIILFLDCKKDEPNVSLDGEYKGIINTAPPGVFYIELVDANDNNLIENGFYESEQITVTLNGEAIEFLDIVSSEPSELQNLVVLPLIGNKGDNRWLINLSETDVDTLDFSMSDAEIRYISDGALYCGVDFY